MKISVITVTYNSAKTLASTLDSVLRQTYKDIEYWVVDGQSTDGTLDIIKAYEGKFGGRLHWISEPDRGIYDAMNKGIARCTGDIVGTLNSDDYFTTDDVLQHIADHFTPDIDAVYGDIHFIRDDQPEKATRYYSSALFRPMWLRFGFMPAHPSFYVRRSVYEKHGGYSLDYKIAADYEMMVRLFHKYKLRARYLHKDCVTMRMGGVSTKNVRNRMLITHEDVRACRQNGLYSNHLLISVKYLYKIFELRF